MEYWPHIFRTRKTRIFKTAVTYVLHEDYDILCSEGHRSYSEKIVRIGLGKNKLQTFS